MAFEVSKSLRVNTEDIPNSTEDDYKALFPALINAVQIWWDSYKLKRSGWKVIMNLTDGIAIHSPGLSNDIYIPLELSSELKVGWKSIYGARFDPKKEIVNTLIDILTSVESLKSIMVIEEGDFVAADLGYYDDEFSGDSDQFTPYWSLYNEDEGILNTSFKGMAEEMNACTLECDYCGGCKF